MNPNPMHDKFDKFPRKSSAKSYNNRVLLSNEIKDTDLPADVPNCRWHYCAA